MRKYDHVIFELSNPHRRAYEIPKNDIEEVSLDSFLPKNTLRKEAPELPQVSQVDLMRHYTNLSNKNYGVDTGFYPLGSCTMKYNPKINEDMARLPYFSKSHPMQDVDTVQGNLQLMDELDQMLSEITGMDKMTLQPIAGSHGEMTGLMLMKAYHQDNGEDHRTKIIVPDSSHGTNPASATMAGFDIVEIESRENGEVDLDALKEALGDDIAGLMLTNPNTLGLFETQITEISALVHEAGGLLYYDGANMNAIMGKTRPGDMGFDIIHLNLHKTFSTPHGGGGPGSGPVGVKERLIKYLPVPFVKKEETGYRLDYDYPKSIGKVSNYYGNFGIYLRAYTYILSMGRDGLKKASEVAVLNANYILSSLKSHYKIAVDRHCMHECVFAGLRKEIAEMPVVNIAKRLLDYGHHPPTVYFPLIVHEAIMIEPTETESKEMLDEFIEAMKAIAEEAKTDPETVKGAPYTMPVKKLDEVGAARNPIVRWSPKES